jgi:membrane protein YqaA with SNARE-associated domain
MGTAVGTSAGWLLSLVGALAAFGLGGWIGYVLGRNTQHKSGHRTTGEEGE